MLVAPAIHCRIPEHLGMERVSSSGKLGAWTFRVDNVLSRCGTRLMKLDSTLNQFLPSYQALVFESPLEQNLHLYGVLSTNTDPGDSFRNIDPGLSEMQTAWK